jgi:hypothetical protein
MSMVAVQMTQSYEGDQRRERAVFETDGRLITGDVTLPREGYASRLSDALNRDEIGFIPLTDVEIATTSNGDVTRREFILLGKSHIKLAYPVESSE